VKIGVRAQLFGTSAILILGLGIVGMILTEWEVRRVLEERSTSDLVAEASLARSLVRARHPAEVGEVAAELSRATGADVIIFEGAPEASGPSQLRIVADSKKEGMEGETLAGLPEVQSAWVEGEGSWIGKEPCSSASCATRGVAVAIVWRDDSLTGMVRLHRDLAEVDVAASWLGRVIGLAGLVGLAVALFMSGLASRVLSRTLHDLVGRARAMARGEGGRVLVPDDDALGGLAGSINDLGAGLEGSIRELARQRDLQGTVLEGLADGVVALDEALRITTANMAATELLGLVENPVGKPLIDVARLPALLDLAYAARDGRRHAHAEDALAPHAIETDIDLSHPLRRRVLVTAHTLVGGGCVLVLRDVTEARRIETMRRDFVANASHELRTPVAAIQASIEALCDGAASDPEAAPGFLDAVRRNALRLSRVVDDLLDLSRLESGQARIALERVEIGPIVLAALLAVRPSADARHIALGEDVAEGLVALADRNALDQILANLLDNAVKYTPEGGRVEVVAQSSGHTIHIAVRDTGPGIPPQHRSRIFERFYRVDTARSRALGGTGLGLAIVKHLVERMSGEVALDCPDTGGSVFTVLLPSAG
jgi:two-component system, OmpR family, phosphate regulon sensor histidine kinase PhoR